MPGARLHTLSILGYGLGHVANDICASMWFTYFLLFYQKVTKLLIACTFHSIELSVNKQHLALFLAFMVVTLLGIGWNSAQFFAHNFTV